VVALVALLMVSAGAWVVFMGGKADPSSEFMTEFEELTSKEMYAHSSWGLMVFDPESNATLFDIRSGEMFVPGSTTKLFTSAAIMMAMGADHRFTTPVYAASMDDSGAVDGPLVLVASGDPNMGGRAMEGEGINYTDEDHSYALIQGGCILTSEDPLAGIDSLASQIYGSGMRSVEDVVVDDTLFETVEMDEFVISPIIINDKLLDIMVRPGADGEVSVTARPSTDFFTIRNEVVTSDATNIEITASGRDITVRGQIAEESEQVNLTHTVREPAAFARALLIESLVGHGIDVTSSATGGNPGT